MSGMFFETQCTDDWSASQPPGCPWKEVRARTQTPRSGSAKVQHKMSQRGLTDRQTDRETNKQTSRAL